MVHVKYLYIYMKYVSVEFTCLCSIKNVHSLQFCMILFHMNERNPEFNALLFFLNNANLM